MAKRYEISTIFKAIDQMTAPIRRMQKSVSGMIQNTELRLRRLDRSMSSVGRTMARGFGTVIVSAGAAAGAVSALLKQFSKIEDAEASFTPLLGGAEKARQLVSMLNKTAASTPFQFETLADTASQLLPVMNGDLQKTVETIRMLGDTAGGNAQKLDSITRGFTKAMLKGKVDMESLNMIAEAGVPIFQDLAQVMGVDMDEAFFKMISAGKVTTDDLTKTFRKLTSEGGKFFGGMEIASRTLSGKWSTMKDNIAAAAAAVGAALAPAVKELVDEVTLVAQSVAAWAVANKDLIKSKFESFVAGVRKALTFIVQNGAKIAKVTAWVVGLVVALKVLIAVLTVINLVMAANPIVLIILAIIAAVTALVFAIRYVVKNFDSLVASFDSLPLAAKGAILAMMGPIGWLIGAALILKENWKEVAAFFVAMWDAVLRKYEQVVSWTADLFAKIAKLSDEMKSSFDWIKSGQIFEDTEWLFRHEMGKIFAADGTTPAPSVVTPGQKTAAAITSSHSETTSAEITIRDETNRAQVTSGQLSAGVTLKQSGVF